MAYIVKAKSGTIQRADTVRTIRDKDHARKYLAQTAGNIGYHVVTYSKDNNSFTCSCQAFTYGHGLACKHIISVAKKFVKNIEIITEK